MDINNRKIAVIGLGYVGLPLAVEFGKKYITVGFDINTTRISELESGNDRTLEVSKGDLAASELLVYTNDEEFLKQFDVFVVTVPTPIDKNKRPDLRPLIKASETVGKALKKGDVVIYESTVYPGATEEDCVPVLEKLSGLKYNEDFFCGYSPERINPGDKVHTVTKIQKVTSGSTPEVADFVDQLYSSIITAGTYKASSIKVAEAAKVIENSQRDINIAFVNELSVIFSRIGIDTHEVLEAAGTKWNFLPFKPGLVGGHCIGVDPYYLTQKAQELGYNPEIMLAGRRLNDRMPVFVASMVIKEMIKKKHRISESKILVLGLTFKENCPDVRNSKVIALIHEFNEFGCHVDVYDPWADKKEVMDKYGIELLSRINGDKYDSIVLAVAHSEFEGLDYVALKNGGSAVIYDIKGVLPKEVVDCRL
nr:nucleotide sugar dehydrogenase [Ancylomarina sp. DW003]